MSTRGYVTLIDQHKNILLSAFCPSSAYPSYFGLEVLDALKDGSFPSFIQQLQEDYPDEKEMTDGITRDWYIKHPSNPNQYFQDYAYEYAPSSAVLNLYHFGEKVLSIPVQEIPLYRGIFELEHALSLHLRYDPVSCMLKKDYYTELRRMLRSGTTLDAFRELCAKPLLYMDRYRFRGSGWSKDDFSKEVFDSEIQKKLIFHASKNGNHYTLYIQTPFYRAPLVTKPLLSPTAVEKELARMLRDEPDKIRNAMSLFQKIDQYQRDVKAVFSDDAVPDTDKKTAAYTLLDTMLTALEEAQASGPVLGSRDDSFNRHIRELVFRKTYALEQDALSKHPPLDHVIANAQQDADNPAPEPEVPPVKAPLPERI